MDQITFFEKNKNEKTFNEICDVIGCKNYTPGWPDEFGKKINNYIKENKIKKIRTLSLFSGAGGLDIGFSDIGFEIVSSVEVESKFCKTLELNSVEGKRFEGSKVNCTDIREFSAKNIGEIDFIIGGPPCQTFSAAGRRAAGVLGINDERGMLFKEYVRLLEETSPKGFLFENVSGIISAQNGEAWKQILDSFAEIGYKLYYRLLDAADYGVPQHRERLLIVGVKDNINFKFPRPTHGPDSLDKSEYYNALDAINDIVINEEEEEGKINGKYGYLLNDIPPGLNYSFYTEKMGHPNPIFAWRSKFSDFLYKADPDVPVRTIKAQGGQYTGPFHWNNRVFTSDEYKRLQTFPDDYKINGNRQDVVKQIGNSVPPQLARIMAISIRKQIFNSDLEVDLPLMDESQILSFRSRKRLLTEKYKSKAEEAIKSIKKENILKPKSREYTVSLSDKFEYDKKLDGEYRVSVKWNENLEIHVYDNDICYNDVEIFAIKILPAGVTWNMDVKYIQVRVYSRKTRSFTVAWKAIEEELVVNNIKSDLVQLSGYYQYTPSIICQLDIFEEMSIQNPLKLIVEGKVTGRIYNESELADIWGVSKNEIIQIAEELKFLGYEIRNNNTNPQIEEGNWLIPYTFPTLNPKSVQLKKDIKKKR